jgi:hypothetical protein
MIAMLQVSSHIYGRLIELYPADLYREFGAEMALVFADDLEAARSEAGLWGVLRVWRCALGEFLRIVPAGHPALRVSAVWFALSVAILGVEEVMWLGHELPGLTPFHAILAALTLPALLSPGFSLAAIWICHGDEVIAMDLAVAPRREHEPCSKYGI